MIDLAIVTTASNGYGRFLHEWAGSILELTLKPAQVAIFTHGPGADEAAGSAAALRLQAAGIPTRHEHAPKAVDLGTARNRAVALTDTGWVSHFDADDLLMPHALEDVAELMPGADVVCLGYQCIGNGVTRKKVYRSSIGREAIHSTAPASGPSPFRRSLWLRSPYRSDMIGGWDTGLWLGFAHLGARFVPTRRPCFFYRQRSDSVFNTRRADPWVTRIASQKFNSLRRNDRGVSVIVPRSPDGAERDRAWVAVRAWYERHFPGWELVEGHAPAGPWIKGLAVADALVRASGAILVLADSDCLVSAGVLREAVACVEAGAPWCIPHELVHRLSAPASSAFLARPLPEAFDAPAPGDLCRQPYIGFPGGGILVVPRLSYELVGGFPVTFTGWGGEDEALGLALDTIAGKHERLGADLLHLWHRPAARSQRSNRPLVNQYQAAARDPAAMRRLILGAGGGGTYSSIDPIARAADIRARQNVTRIAVLGVFDTQRDKRLALAQPSSREAIMAGARDVKKAYAQRRAEQAARNAEAAADEERRRMAAFGGERTGSESRKARYPMGPDKMLPGPAEDKGSGVSLTITPPRPKVERLVDVPAAKPKRSHHKKKAE